MKMGKWKHCFPIAIAFFIFMTGCATTSKLQENSQSLVEILSLSDIAMQFKASDFPNPFMSPKEYLSTLPQKFITAKIIVPGNGSARFEIASLAIYDADSKILSRYSTKEDLIAFWQSIDYDNFTTSRQIDMINRYYLPGEVLTGRLLGHSYVVIFMSKNNFPAGSKLVAELFVNGEQKIVTIDVPSNLNK